MEDRRLGLGVPAKLDAAFEVAGDGHADAAGRVRIDPQVVLDDVDGGRRIVLGQEGAAQNDDPVRLGVRDVEAVFGQVTVVAWSHEQILAAFAAIRPRPAEVDDPAEPHVVERAERTGGCFHDHRSVREIDEAEIIDRVRIGRQEQRIGIHQFREQKDLVVLDARRLEAFEHRLHADALEGVGKGAERVSEIEIVVGRSRRFRARCAVLEMECPDTRLDTVGCGDRLRHLCQRLAELGGREHKRNGGAGGKATGGKATGGKACVTHFEFPIEQRRPTKSWAV